MYVCYGSHNNDFLLAECTLSYISTIPSEFTKEITDGFVLDHNDWDIVMIDEIVLADLSPQDRSRLEVHKYLGFVIRPLAHTLVFLIWLRDYTLSSTEVCFRTGVAARLLTMKKAVWLKYVKGHFNEGPEHEQMANDKIRGWVQDLLDKADRICATLRSEDTIFEKQPHAKYLLTRRWNQISQISRDFADNLPT